MTKLSDMPSQIEDNHHIHLCNWLNIIQHNQVHLNNTMKNWLNKNKMIKIS